MSSETRPSTINRPVFYTAALFTLLLVGFAIATPRTAQNLFESIQAWILGNASWFYVLAVALILISVVFLAVSRYGDIKLGPDHSRARLPQHHLVRHAVLRRHGHRPDVLRRCRTGDALHHPAGGRAEHRAGGARSDEADLLPLGPACLGDLRHRRADPGLLQLSPRPAADPALGAVSADRRTYLRPHRPRGGHLRHHRHRVRRGDLAGLRRAADQQRPAPPVRLAGEPDRADRPDRRHLRPGHAIGGQRPGPGHPHPVRTEPGPGGDPAALRAGPRPDRVPPADLRAEHRGLPVRHRQQDLQPVRLRAHRLDRRLDPAVLGLVAVLVALRGPVHRPHLARPHHPRIRLRRAVRPGRLHPAVDDGVRRYRHPHGPAGGLHPVGRSGQPGQFGGAVRLPRALPAGQRDLAGRRC